MSTAPSNLAQVTPTPVEKVTEDEKHEADCKWNERLDYLCQRTNDVLVNIIRLHWEEGEWLNTAMKDQRRYGSRVVERYVEDCAKREIKTAVSSVYKYMDFNAKYSRTEVERAIERHITWHQLANGGISIPTKEGRDKWELAVREGKFEKDEDVIQAARDITAEEKQKRPPKEKEGKAPKAKTKQGMTASQAKMVCRTTVSLCTETVKKMDEFHDALKAIDVMEEGKARSELVAIVVRDTFRIFGEIQKRIAGLEEARATILKGGERAGTDSQ